MRTLSVPAEAAPQARSSASDRKPHLRQLDRLRIITALSVVAVHVLGNSSFLDQHFGSLVVQDMFVTSFHFTREVFMFVTALALVYVYYGKPFDTGRFWRRRALGVLLPYCAWSVIYVLANVRPSSVGQFLWSSLVAIVTGNASYQLYYIMLTLEFYIIFPWVLRILPLLARHLKTTLIVSFTLEVVFLFADHQLLPIASLSAGANTAISQFLDRFVLVYQFYFVLGALAALHLPAIKAFMLRHGAWMVIAGFVSLIALEVNYLAQVAPTSQAMARAVAVLQPMMAPYSLGAIAFLYWLALTLAESASRRKAARTERVWHQLSDAAFGVYLVHPLFIASALFVFVPLVRGQWPTALIIFCVWVIAAVCSVGATIVLLRTPILSRFVGRPGPSPRWLATLRAWWDSRIALASLRFAPMGAPESAQEADR